MPVNPDDEGIGLDLIVQSILSGPVEDKVTDGFYDTLNKRAQGPLPVDQCRLCPCRIITEKRQGLLLRTF